MSVSLAPARWPVAASTTVLWAAAAASVVFWGLRLGAPADVAAPAPVSSAPSVAIDSAAVARGLGLQTAPERTVAAPQAASRFSLLGVVADESGQGAALIAVDGKPARPFRVGAALADGFVLQSLDARAARVGGRADGPAAFELKLPARPLAQNAPPRPLPTMPAP